MASLRPDVAGLRFVQLSHLKCGECGFEFDYQWVPVLSLTLIRLGKSREIRCPKCKNTGRASTFQKQELNREAIGVP